jgi:hypothetical protein
MRWVIGDVHGMRLALEALLNAIAKRDPLPKLIFAGDFVNRGPDSQGVIKLLLTLNNASFVRGNHDDILDIILHGKGFCDHPTTIQPVAAFHWFMQHGLAETLVSYGADAADLEYAAEYPTEDRVHEAVSVIPESHREFVRNLPPLYEDDDVFVAHAMWDADDSDDDIAGRLAKKSGEARFKVLWGRFADDDIERSKSWRRTGYFGHTPVQTYRGGSVEPLRGPNIFLLDTGAALSVTGRLSAVCVETGECVQVHRNGKPVESK